MWNKKHLCGRRENLETWDVWRFQSTAFILCRSIFISTSIVCLISLFGLGHSRFFVSPLRLSFFVDDSLRETRPVSCTSNGIDRSVVLFSVHHTQPNALSAIQLLRALLFTASNSGDDDGMYIRYTLFRLWNECAQVALLTLERSHHKNADELKKKNKANRLLNKLTARKCALHTMTANELLKMKKTTRRKRNEE